MWLVTLSRERSAILINIISKLRSKSGFVRLLDKLPKGMLLNEKKITCSSHVSSHTQTRMHKHTLFHLLHAGTVCCVNWSFQDTTSLTAEQKQQAEHCQSICPFSSAPSALRWCKALIIPVIWIPVSRSDPRAQQSQHHYRCGGVLRWTEVPLTWFQLDDLHSSQLPGSNVSSLKGKATVSQSRNLIPHLFTTCCGFTKES